MFLNSEITSNTFFFLSFISSVLFKESASCKLLNSSSSLPIRYSYCSKLRALINSNNKPFVFICKVGSYSSIIEKQVSKGSIICSDSWRAYTELAAKGYVHRIVEHNKNKYSDKKGNRINGPEGFWGYLKRKLSSKGGIRREKLPLYLGEYVWRYNYRRLTLKEQKGAYLR
jgi:transposase-like protein